MYEFVRFFLPKRSQKEDALSILGLALWLDGDFE